MERHPGTCLDVNTDFDIALWDAPTATIRRPDIALFTCAPDEITPLPASLIRIVVEVVSPQSDKTDRVEKMGEYALAGIPWYWLVWMRGNGIGSIDVYVLDHTIGGYRLHKTLFPEDEASSIEMPLHINIDWARLAELTR